MDLAEAIHRSSVLEASPESPTWTGAPLDRTGTKTAIPVTVGQRTDNASGQRWLTADVTLAPLGSVEPLR